MKIEKTNGVYKKPGLRLSTKVPVLVWLSIVLVAFAWIISVVFQTMLLMDQTVPGYSRIRKHSFRIAAVGDIACSPADSNFNEGEGVVGGCGQQEVGLAVERENTDAVFLLGDVQYDTGRFEDFERSFVPYWRDIQSPMYVAMGNHDYGNGAVVPANTDGLTKAMDVFFPKAVYEGEGKSYYKRSFGIWDVYVLDSNCEYVGGCDAGSEQHQWLTRQVNAASTRCSVAVWHHPTATSGVHKNPEDTDRAKPLAVVLENAGVDLVLNGHDHHYERIQNSAYTQFVVGTGGMSVRRTTEPYAPGSQKIIDDTFGYLYLQLFPGRYEWQFKDTIGHVLDEGTENCK